MQILLREPWNQTKDFSPRASTLWEKKWHLGSKIAGTSGRCQGPHKNVRDSQELGMFKDRKGQGDKG